MDENFGELLRQLRLAELEEQEMESREATIQERARVHQRVSALRAEVEAHRRVHRLHRPSRRRGSTWDGLIFPPDRD